MLLYFSFGMYAVKYVEREKANIINHFNKDSVSNSFNQDGYDGTVSYFQLFQSIFKGFFRIIIKLKIFLPTSK